MRHTCKIINACNPKDRPCTVIRRLQNIFKSILNNQDQRCHPSYGQVAKILECGNGSTGKTGDREHMDHL